MINPSPNARCGAAAKVRNQTTKGTEPGAKPGALRGTVPGKNQARTGGRVIPPYPYAVLYLPIVGTTACLARGGIRDGLKKHLAASPSDPSRSQSNARGATRNIFAGQKSAPPEVNALNVGSNRKIPQNAYVVGRQPIHTIHFGAA